MLKKIAFAGLGIVLLATPLFASAQTASDLQAQIENLLAQIKQLQAQIAQLQSGGTTVTPPTPPATPPCPVFTRTLAQGATGNDVTQLQQYLGVSPTGYFGPATAQAVTAVQANAGLSQVGIVGPATRAWFWKRCGGGGGWNQNFSATPTSGQAPLGVTFSYADSTSGNSYSIDFGDGSSGTLGYQGPVPTCFGCSARSPYYATTHTYTSNGTYTATLTYQPSFSCPAGAMCPEMMPAPQTIGTVTITVGGSTSGTSISVSSPVSGQNVAQGGTLSVAWNSQNAPAGSAVGLWLIQTRAPGGPPMMCPVSNDPAALPCGSQNLGLIAANQSTSGNYTWTVPVAQTTTGCTDAFNCIKQYGVGVAIAAPCPLDTPFVCGNSVAQGSYMIIAKLYTPANACLGGLCSQINPATFLAASQSGVFTIGSGGGCDKLGTYLGNCNSGAPSISGLDAPTSLAVGQTGTWTVHANTTNSGNLSYSVTWGDENWAVPMAAQSAASPSIATSGTFTHAYQSAGSFNPTFTVSNSSGSAQTSASVVVGKNTPILSCPQYSLAACINGTYVSQGTDANGCRLAPRCVLNGGGDTTSGSGSCVSYNTTYTNGSTVGCTVQPGAGTACPLGLSMSSWMCSNGQWVTAQATPATSGGAGQYLCGAGPVNIWQSTPCSAAQQTTL